MVETAERKVPEVYRAIVEVQKAIAKEGIAKDRNNQAQGYKFRGIDDIYNALAEHIAKANLCILPSIHNRQVTERRSSNGGVIFSVTVEAYYTFVSAIDGSTHGVTVIGEAMDSGDKATNKAMSAAYKYACLQVFCIPTEGDNDADATTHVVAAEPLPQRERKPQALPPPGSVYVYNIDYSNEQARGIAKEKKLRFSSKKEGGDNKWRGGYVKELEAFIVERPEPQDHSEPAADDDDIPF